MDRRKGKKKRWIILLVGLALLAGACVLFWPQLQRFLPFGMGGMPAGGAAGAVRLNTAEVTRGDLTVTVYGSGSMTPSESQTVFTGGAGKVEQVHRENGDIVQAGEAVITLSSDDLDEEIATLESELFTAQYELSQMRDSGGASTIYSPAAGRVKMITAQEGDDVAVLMKQYGYLCVISRDGKMKVAFEPTESGLSIGDPVKVMVGAVEEEGTVDQVTGLQGKIAVTIGNDSYAVGQEVTVLSVAGDKLGEGTLEVNMPVPVMGIGGTVSEIYRADNEKVSSGTSLFYLEGRIPTADMKQQQLAYEKARVKLDNAYSKLDSLVIRAPIDGIVSDINVSAGETLEESVVAFNIKSADSFTIVATVDELDIVNVEVGQSAQVEVDALDDKTFAATVSRISALGTVESGVATYEVTLTLEESEGIMDGMTASANIVVADKQQVLLAPVSCISTRGGQNYVTVVTYNESGEAVTTNQDVTIGMSDDDSVEILEGVSEGDLLVNRETSSSSSTSEFGGMGGGAMMMDMGGGAPGGGMGGGMGGGPGGR